MRNLEYHTEMDSLPQEDGGGYLAIVPGLPGFMSDGATRAAASNVQARSMSGLPRQSHWDVQSRS